MDDNGERGSGAPASTQDTVDYRTALQLTFRYLRVGLAFLVLMLAVAIIDDFARTGTLQDSVSAYYYTDVHAIFVGTMCAAGASLVIYRGLSDVEDLLLNVAGFAMFVVALLPTMNVSCRPEDLYCPIPVDVLENNLTALLVTSSAVLVFMFLLGLREPSTVRLRTSPRTRTSYWITLAAFVAVLGVWVFARELFLSAGHLTAAVVVFSAMAGVIYLHGVQLNSQGAQFPRLRQVYWISFALILIGTAVLGAAVLLPRLGGPEVLANAGFWLETFLLATFGLFWLTQTFFEVWDEPAVGFDVDVRVAYR